MQLTIIHDLDGNITSVAASPPDSPVLYLQPKPGQLQTTVDAPELKQADISQYLADLVQNHRIVEHTKAKLARKESAPARKSVRR